MTIIKCIMQYRWRIKTRLNVVYKIKTMLKCLFIFVDQNETKQNVITLFCLVLSRYYYFAVFLFPVSHYRGCHGCQVFATKPAQLLLKTSPKLAQSHFEGGSPQSYWGRFNLRTCKTTRGNSVKVAQFRGKAKDMATLCADAGDVTSSSPTRGII